MDLVFLFGPAAVGKLTVGRELAKLTGYRLFHNHLVVDAVGAVFEFGSEPFVRLREEIWLSVFREAAASGISVIFTFAPERTVTESFPKDAIEAVSSEGGHVRFVELVCPQDELEARIDDASRGAYGKLRDLKLFRSLGRDGAFDSPRMPEPELVVDTSKSAPGESARAIAAHLESA